MDCNFISLFALNLYVKQQGRATEWFALVACGISCSHLRSPPHGGSAEASLENLFYDAGFFIR